MAKRTIACWVAMAWCAFGCIDRELKPLNPCTQSAFGTAVVSDPIQNVDLLFVIDNSGSMEEEQESLEEQIPRLVRVLTTGDRDLDGSPDFPAVASLRVGIVSTDMGTGGHSVTGCDNSNFGDDAVLLQRGDPLISGCSASYPNRIMTFEPADFPPDARAAEAERFADEVRCRASLGIEGCALEQQLEASLKAVTPAGCNQDFCSFALDSRGHVDGPNEGFVREDSLLAIVMLTDEEDCSVNDLAFFDQSSSYGPIDNMSCLDHPQAAYAIDRYVRGLLASRPNPERLVFALIAGVPTDLTYAGDGEDSVTLDQIATELGQFQVLDPRCVTDPRFRGCPRPRPSCDNGERGEAFAPVRLVQVARELELRGANSVVQSICQEDFTPALDAIIDRIGSAIDQQCLPRRLNPDAQGLVPCDVIETLPATGALTTCAAVNRQVDPACDTDPSRCSRIAIGTSPSGSEICKVVARTASIDALPTAPGWYYDDFSDLVREKCAADRPQRIAYTEGAAPVAGTRVRLECVQPVEPDTEGVLLDVHSICRVAGERCAAGAPPASDSGRMCARDLVCDEILRTWELECTADADCPGGWRCDGARSGGAICRNPTCG
jgi:hypothetical protein